MKQGIKYALPVEIGMDLTKASSVKLKFAQLGHSLVFTWSGTDSQTVKRSGNTLVTYWTAEQTLAFKPAPVMIDALITCTDGTQPETTMDRIDMHPTLFTRTEVG